MVPVHDPGSKPTIQCTYHHIQCTLYYTATLCTLQPNIQCTHYSSHYIFSAPTTAAITSSVHTLQQPLNLQCTLQHTATLCSLQPNIFSAHTTAAMYSHVQLSATNLQCTLQPTAAYSTAIPFSAQCSNTI